MKRQRAQSSAKSSKKKAEPPPLPEAHAALASLYAATLSAASFLAPKGLSCTLDKLAPTVRALSGGEFVEMASTVGGATSTCELDRHAMHVEEGGVAPFRPYVRPEEGEHHGALPVAVSCRADRIANELDEIAPISELAQHVSGGPVRVHAQREVEHA